MVLEPSWAIRAIETTYLLARIEYATTGQGITTDSPLVRVLRAAPADPTAGTDRSTLGEGGDLLASALMDAEITDPAGFYTTLESQGAIVHLHPAIRTARMDARLRKVKNEYCAVVRTYAEWPNMEFGKLKNGINPANWPAYFGGFFCAMGVVPAPDPYGWTLVHEEVSGECARYRLRTPLKFWSQRQGAGLFLNYDLAFDTWPQADKMVLVDNGYISITPMDPNNPVGVRVRTSKQLLISGLSATAFAVLAKTMGFATNATDMFLKLDAYTGGPLTAFAPSVAIPPAPAPDTSTTWPALIPALPADLRDEMCGDTNHLLKEGLDLADDFVADFSHRWNNGIDVDDFNALTDRLATSFDTFVKDVFTTATANFRPKTDPGP